TEPARSDIWALSLHDALPIFYESADGSRQGSWGAIDFGKPEQFTREDATVKVDNRFDFGKSGAELPRFRNWQKNVANLKKCFDRSEEHTSELQSHLNLVCRLM